MLCRWGREDLNQLVRRHIQTAVAAAPGKAVSTLENDTYELIAAGMVTLDSRLAGVEDDKLIMRIVDLWTFFWVQVLPYLEGVSRSLSSFPLSSHRSPSSSPPAGPPPTPNRPDPLLPLPHAQSTPPDLAHGDPEREGRRGPKRRRRGAPPVRDADADRRARARARVVPRPHYSAAVPAAACAADDDADADEG